MQFSVIIAFVYYDLFVIQNDCDTIFAAKLRPVIMRNVITK